MKVNVKLYGPLRDQLPKENKGKAELDLPDGATVGDALVALKLTHRIVMSAVNDAHESEESHPLADGDRLAIFEAVAGG